MTSLLNDKHFIMTDDPCHKIVRWTHYLMTTLFKDKTYIVSPLWG